MAKTNQLSLPMGTIPLALPPLEANQPEKAARKRRGGRRKIPMQRINDDQDLLITFSKRKAGIYKKAMEIGTLCGVDIGILIFSPAGKAYAYGIPNIESITDRFLWGVNPGALNDTMSGMVNEAQRRENVGKLNKMCDELSVRLQNLKVEGDKLAELKKQTLDSDSWWEIPVQDLGAAQMQMMKNSMEELKTRLCMRVVDLREGTSSSRAVVQPKDIQMGINEGFGHVGDRLLGGGARGSGIWPCARFGDWRAGCSPAAGILGGFGGFGDWGASSSVQAGGMQMRGNGITGHGGGVVGGFGALTVGGSSSARIQQGGMQVGGYGGGVSGGGDDADGGVGGGLLGGFGAYTVGGSSSARVQQGGRQVREFGGCGSSGGDVAGDGIGGGVLDDFSALTASGLSAAIVQPTVGSMLVGGNLGSVYTGSAGGSGGYGDLRAGGSAAAGIQGGGFQQDGNGGLGGLGDWGASSSVKAGGKQMGGIGGSGFGGAVGGGYTAGASTASAQKGGVQVGECVGGEFGGIGQWKPVELSSGWKPVNSSLTFKDIQASNPMQTIGRNGRFGNLGGAGAGGGGGGHDSWRSVGSPAMQMGSIGGFGHDVGGRTTGGAAGGSLGGWGAGGASSSSLPQMPMQMSWNGGLDFGGFGGGFGNEFGGGGSGFGDVAVGSSAAVAIDLDQGQMGGTGNGDSFYDGGDGNGTNNRFAGFGGGKLI